MSIEGVELLHTMPGRIRFRVPAIKANPALARDVQKQLSGLKGIRRVEANPVTGSVLILYDAEAPIAELAGRLFPGLDWEERMSSGVAGPEAAPQPQASPLAERVADYCRGLNASVATVTGGADLKVLLPATLLLFGIKGLVSSKERTVPTWYDFLWFSFGTFLMLNRDIVREDAPPGEDDRPGGRPLPTLLARNGTHGPRLIP